MGTIMTICMIVAIAFTNRLPAGGLNRASPSWLLKLVGGISVLAASWNVFWYAFRHPTEFWGQMAFGSGLLLFACAASLLTTSALPAWYRNLRHWIVLALAGFAFVYGYTIYHL